MRISAAAMAHREGDLVAAEARQGHKTVRQIVLERRLLTAEEFDELVSAERTMQLGSNVVAPPAPPAEPRAVSSEPPHS